MTKYLHAFCGNEQKIRATNTIQQTKRQFYREISSNSLLMQQGGLSDECPNTQ